MEEAACLCIRNVGENGIALVFKALLHRSDIVHLLVAAAILEEAAMRQGFSLLEKESEEEWAMLLFEANALGRRDV